jgi:hypothetical protein
VRFTKDAIERIVMTAIGAGVAASLAALDKSSGMTTRDLVAVALGAAAFSTIKCVVAGHIGNVDSASLVNLDKSEKS